MSANSLIGMLVFGIIPIALYFGTVYLLNQGFRWIADTIDRLCGIDTSH